jgi:hypothetical protein
MLGRKTYTQAEIDYAKTSIAAQLKAYTALVSAVTDSGSSASLAASLAAFEPLFFNNLALALDRPFVHRIRPVTGKDGNPLNELEVICDSLMNNNGVFGNSTVIKLLPDQSVLKLRFGDTIALTAEQFGHLSTAFFAELERKFL